MSKKGMYYTPKNIIDPAAGSGAFLKEAADLILQNPPHGSRLTMRAADRLGQGFLLGFICGLVIAAVFALVLFGGG